MSTQKRRKVARQLKYRRGGERGDDGYDGGIGVREPRRPLPPSPVSGAGALPLPESIIMVKLPNPPVRPGGAGSAGC